MSEDGFTGSKTRHAVHKYVFIQWKPSQKKLQIANLQAEISQIKHPIYKNFFSLTNKRLFLCDNLLNSNTYIQSMLLGSDK